MQNMRQSHIRIKLTHLYSREHLKLYRSVIQVKM